MNQTCSISASHLTSLALAVLTLGVIPVTAQFTPGNLAVFRIGDGSTALTSISAADFVDEYTKAGGLVHSIVIPTDGSGLVSSGSASSEGFLTRSADGRLLTFGGYAAASGVTSIANTTGTTANRAVGVIAASGTFSRVSTGSTSLYSGNNIRSAVSDGTSFWTTGTATAPNGGSWYSANGATPAQIQDGNFRVANIISGNLYYSTGSGTPGIYSYTGLPTGAAVATLVIGTGASTSPYDFAISPGGAIAYITIDTASAAGGIERWDLSAGTWSLTYTLGTGVANIGARGLAVDFSGPNPVIYATTAEATADRLITLTDTGAASAATTLATAAANEIFRGVDFVPIPEPSTWALAGLGAVLFIVSRRWKV